LLDEVKEALSEFDEVLTNMLVLYNHYTIKHGPNSKYPKVH